MRRALPFVLAAMLAALAAGCGGRSAAVRTVTVPSPAAPSPGADGLQRVFGHIVAVRRSRGGYEVRFDPAWFLSGVTANAAAAADLGPRCEPRRCPPVPNDNYVVDESHRTYTFLMPAQVRGTVLVRHGTGPFPATRIGAAALARLVAGTSRLRLFEPLESGILLLVRVDTVRAFAQQYRP